MTQIPRHIAPDNSSSFPKQLYMAFAMGIGCITYGAHQRGQLDDTIEKAKTIWTEMTTSGPHNQPPLKPTCEETEAYTPKP